MTQCAGKTLVNETYRTKFVKEDGSEKSLRCAAVLNAIVAAGLEELSPDSYLTHSDTGIKSIMRNAIASLTFSIKHLILAAMFYLSLILINTLARELASFVSGAIRHFHIPFWISYELMCNLVYGTNSDKVFKNKRNMYAVATRKRVSINEAVNETLHALKLQVINQSCYKHIYNAAINIGFTLLCCPLSHGKA